MLVCVYFQGLRRYLLKSSRVVEYIWSVIDSWHCTDRRVCVCLCENRLASTSQISLFPVSSNLLKLHVLGEWANETSTPVLEKYVIGARFHYGIPFGALWLKCLGRAMIVCLPVFEHNCISVCPQPNLVSVGRCSYGSLGRKGKTGRRIKILKTSLDTSGYDWQRKRGPVCSGNWQKLQPNPVQPSPVDF